MYDVIFDVRSVAKPSVWFKTSGNDDEEKWKNKNVKSITVNKMFYHIIGDQTRVNNTV